MQKSGLAQQAGKAVDRDVHKLWVPLIVLMQTIIQSKLPMILLWIGLIKHLKCATVIYASSFAF